MPEKNAVTTVVAETVGCARLVRHVDRMGTVAVHVRLTAQEKSAETMVAADNVAVVREIRHVPTGNVRVRPIVLERSAARMVAVEHAAVAFPGKSVQTTVRVKRTAVFRPVPVSSVATTDVVAVVEPVPGE